MLREPTFEKLYSMKLRAMAEAFQQQIQQPDLNSLSFEERFAMVVDAQWLWRQNRALSVRLKKAQMKLTATLEDLNYRHTRQLDRAQMRTLASGQWVGRHQNVLITGPSGIGKTYLCCALLEKACRQGYSSFYVRAPRLFRNLTVAYADGSFDRVLTKLARTDVLAIDDWGLAALNDAERRHLLEVIEDRHESRSTIITSQFPVSTWHGLIGNPSMADAILDRLTSGAHRVELQGDSMRSADPRTPPGPNSVREPGTGHLAQELLPYPEEGKEGRP
jgi:DNA replication protein DnaC